MLLEMNRIRDEFVSEDDLSRIKNNMIGNFALSLENQQTIARYALNVERYNLPKNYYRDMLDKVQQVTKEMIQKAAKEFIHPDNCHILVVGNKEIADKLVQFDSDQTVDFYDYNAEPVEAESKPLPEGLTAEDVLFNYIMAQTSTKSIDDAKKKFKKIKSFRKEMSASIDAQGQTFTMEMIEQFKSPSFYKSETIAMGMTVQSEVINSKSGGTQNMQTGKTNFTADERSSKLNKHKLDSDLYYKENGVTLDLTGIENVMGEDCYVLNRMEKSGEKSTMFLSVSSGLLLQYSSQNTPKEGESPVLSTVQFLEYQENGGILVPGKTVMDINGNALEISLKKMEINPKLKASDFDWEE